MSGRLKVYLETSFVSYLTGGATSDIAVATNQAWTRQWWDTERANCDLFISNYTFEEAARGNEDSVSRRMSILNGLPFVDVAIDRVTALAESLLAGHAIPVAETTDALHIAAAAVAGMDIVLTWNCKHLANPRTLPVTRDIVTKAGYICPAVMTPRTYIENLNMEAKL